MATYRQSRNLEASIVDKLIEDFNADWTGISVEKTFARIYEISLPSICIRVGTTAHTPVEIGSNATSRHPQLFIDIFGTSDGNALDLSDYIVEKIKNGFIYYDYVVVNGVVDTKTENGRIRVKNIEVSPINFDDDKNNLDIHDRYRKLITCDISTGKVEN